MANVQIGELTRVAAQYDPAARCGIGDAVDDSPRSPARVSTVDDLYGRQDKVSSPDVDRMALEVRPTL